MACSSNGNLHAGPRNLDERREYYHACCTAAYVQHCTASLAAKPETRHVWGCMLTALEPFGDVLHTQVAGAAILPVVISCKGTGTSEGFLVSRCNYKQRSPGLVGSFPHTLYH